MLGRASQLPQSNPSSHSSTPNSTPGRLDNPYYRRPSASQIAVPTTPITYQPDHLSFKTPLHQQQYSPTSSIKKQNGQKHARPNLPATTPTTHYISQPTTPYTRHHPIQSPCTTHSLHDLRSIDTRHHSLQYTSPLDQYHASHTVDSKHLSTHKTIKRPPQLQISKRPSRSSLGSVPATPTSTPTPTKGYSQSMALARQAVSKFLDAATELDLDAVNTTPFMNIDNFREENMELKLRLMHYELELPKDHLDLINQNIILTKRILELQRELHATQIQSGPISQLPNGSHISLPKVPVSETDEATSTRSARSVSSTSPYVTPRSSYTDKSQSPGPDLFRTHPTSKPAIGTIPTTQMNKLTRRQSMGTLRAAQGDMHRIRTTTFQPNPLMSPPLATHTLDHHQTSPNYYSSPQHSLLHTMMTPQPLTRRRSTSFTPPAINESINAIMQNAADRLLYTGDVQTHHHHPGQSPLSVQSLPSNGLDSDPEFDRTMLDDVQLAENEDMIIKVSRMPSRQSPTKHDPNDQGCIQDPDWVVSDLMLALNLEDSTQDDQMNDLPIIWEEQQHKYHVSE